MSGVTLQCEHCGKVYTIMAGSPPFCSCDKGRQDLETEIKRIVAGDHRIKGAP